MSRDRFVIADTHFTQASMCAFANANGSPLRPWGRAVANWKQMSEEERNDLKPEFDQRANEMDEALVERWNSVVPVNGATVYHLGDVVMKKQHLSILDRLNGRKKLIPGNHDILPVKEYLKYFYDVQAYRIGDGIIMSHIPIQEDSLKQRWKTNVHGHLHDSRVTKSVHHTDFSQYGKGNWWTKEIHPRYLCVSVEQIDFTPLPWEDMMTRIGKQQR